MEEAKVARQKVPVEWHVLDALPMTMSGKIQKHKLAELAPDHPPAS